MTGIKDMTLKLGECQRMSPTGASQFIAAISPTGLSSCSFPQGNSQKQFCIALFVAVLDVNLCNHAIVIDGQ